MSDSIHIEPIEDISSTFMPRGRDSGGDDAHGVPRHRALHADEIAALVKNNNYAESWERILVTEAFTPNLIINCEFYGRVLVGDLEPKFVEYHDLRLPVGIRNSTIMSCRIGNNVAIRDVHYLAHYAIADSCIIFNVDEMLCTNHAKFGNGIVKEGEEEGVRIWLEVGNENAGRAILPFEGMLPADAWVWSKYRGDEKLLSRFVEITEARFSRERGAYGEVGARTVIKDCRIIKDVKIGTDAYVKGANKLKNITILSSGEEKSQIGEGVELVNGIVGYGSRIFYEAKAIRFVTGRNVQLKYGARLLNSVLGDNSTVSCCELLNNIIFPFHEQHHNNSFLIASTIMGQSNIAAGATIGSNHNSRAPDGEIVAGRGFWPGLCTSFKHNSRFASFVLVAKGSYSYELDIPYPFALVFLEPADEAVHLMPAYWFVHNMYAMARNSWKFRRRDLRKVRDQNIEIDYLAPDTVQEILAAMARLETLAAKAAGGDGRLAAGALRAAGRKILAGERGDETALEDAACMKRFGGRIEKPARGWRHYRDFCAYFAIKTLVDYLQADARTSLSSFLKGVMSLYATDNAAQWVNCGGQVIPIGDLDTLKADLKSGSLASWDAVHARYDELWAAYPQKKARYALFALEQALQLEIASMDSGAWKALLRTARGIFASICDSAYSSRQKDYEDPFRRMLYENDAEMIAVLGRVEDNSFLRDFKKETDAYTAILDSLAGR